MTPLVRRANVVEHIPVWLSTAPVCPAPTRTRQGNRLTLLASGCGLLLAAAFVRCLASRGDLWLDEIWSLGIAGRVSSPLEIPWLADGNSHPLNTLFLLLVGPAPSPTVARALSVLAGVASVALAGCIGLRRGVPEALAAMLFVAASYPMVQFSSEARGYALATCFALASTLALEQRDRPRARGWIALLGASVWLGLLSHPMFALAYLALLLWSAGPELLARRRVPGRVSRIVRWHAIPITALVFYWLPYTLHLGVSGAPPGGIGTVVVQSASLAVGMPGDGPLSRFGAGLGFALLAAGILWLQRRGSDRWVLYLAGTVLTPALFVAATRPPFFFVRYLLTPMAFLYLLLAEMAGALLRRGGVARWTCSALLVAFVLGSVLQAAPLLRHGRGQYRRALEHMAARTPGGRIELASSHDFQARMVFEYHARGLPEHRLVYQSWEDRTRRGAEWLVLHPDDRGSGRPFVTDRHGNRYRLEERFESGPLSGQTFLLYRRVGVDAPRAAPSPRNPSAGPSSVPPRRTTSSGTTSPARASPARRSYAAAVRTAGLAGSFE
jgi:hypothetical protein